MTTASGATPGGSDGAVAFVVSKIFWLATLLLPHGVSRNRYRREFAAEVYGQSPARQLAYALSVCGHVWSLRTVLVYGVDTSRIPLLCRTSLHHHWRKHATAEGLVYRTCSRCGHEKGDLTGTDIDSLFLPMTVGNSGRHDTNGGAAAGL